MPKQINAKLYRLAKTQTDIDTQTQWRDMLTQVADSGALLIDGANIAAHTIYGRSIVAESITADKIKAGSITSDHITSGGITADVLAGGSLESIVPLAEGGSLINLNTGDFNLAGGNLTWNNTTKVLTLNASQIIIGEQQVATKEDIEARVPIAQLIENINDHPSTTRISGAKMHFTNDVTFDQSFHTKLFAQTGFIENLGAYEFSADNIKTGTLSSANGMSTMDLNTGTFSFAEGKLTYDGTTLSVIGSLTLDSFTPALKTSFDGKLDTTKLATSGQVTIHGGNITAGTLTADKITTGTLDASKVTVTNLNATNITAGTLDVGKLTLQNLSASDIKTGILDASSVTIENLSANNIKGGRLDLSQGLTISDGVNDILSIGTDGKVVLKASSIKMGVLDVATKKDVDDIALTPGPQGVSITSVTEWYLATSAATGVTTSTAGWDKTMRTMTTTNKYLWNYEIVNFSDGSTQPTLPVIIGVYGATGATGRGITSIVEQFYLSDSKTVEPPTSGWLASSPTWSPGKYIWTRSLITYTTGTPANSTTKPLVSSEWEAVNELEIGVSNLLKGESKEWRTEVRPVGDWFFVKGYDHKVEVGQTYTFSIVVDKVSSDNVAINLALGLGSSSGLYTWDFPQGTTYNIPFGTRISKTFTVLPIDGASGTHSYFAFRLRNERLATTIRYKEVKLEKGNKATDWSPAPEDLYQYVDDIEVGSTNLLKNSRIIGISSNNNAIYPTSVTPTEEGGRVFNRIRRTNLTLNPSSFSIYSIMAIEDINKSIFENESTVVSFRARASQNVTMSALATTYGGSPIVTGNIGNINITTEWKTFYTIFPKIPKSASGLRFNPTQNITSVNMSTFYLDICEHKIEKGNKPTDWSPAPEDVQHDIGEKADGELTNKAIQEAKQLAYTAQQEAEAKASREQVDALESMYQGMESARQQDMTNVSGDLETALKRVAAIETNLGDQAQQINFVNTHIRMSNEGLVLGDEQKGNYLLQQPDRLDFISNGTVVAYVSSNELWINSGIFTDRLKVGDINIVKQGTNRIRFE